MIAAAFPSLAPDAGGRDFGERPEIGIVGGVEQPVRGYDRGDYVAIRGKKG